MRKKFDLNELWYKSNLNEYFFIFRIKYLRIFDIMNILYRNIPEKVYNLIADKQCELKKERKREISISEAITALIKEAYLKTNSDAGEVLQNMP